jgi:hypothetical protein
MEDDIDAPSQLKAMIESERRMREMLEPPPGVKAMMESERRMREMLEPPPGVKAMMESERRLREMLEPPPGVKAMMESERRMREMLELPLGVKAMMEVERRMRESLGEPLINRLATVAESLTSVACNINPDGSIVGENVAFNIGDYQSVIESCVERTTPSTRVSLEMRINAILDDAASQHPVLAKIIIFILLPIIINIYTSKYFTESTVTNHNFLVKQIKKEVQKKPYDRALINQFRFVSSNTLNVRSKDSTKSKIIGNLYLGDIVQIVEKKKNWSLVKHTDKDAEVIISGWVFTRYIQKFD